MRKPRLLVPGARYHVTAKAHGHAMIFEEDAMKALFLETIARAKKKYAFQVENLCLMGNHLHLIILPGPKECLSTILKWILGVFSQTWHRIHGSVGHGALWSQRFFSRVIDGLSSYLQTFVYIDANPVKAGLVDRKEDWDFGRYGIRRRGWLGILDDPPEDLALLLNL